MGKNIVVIGMGYVGIPAACLFADAGFDVTGIQRRSKRSGWKIDLLNKGGNPIGGNEPGLSDLIKRVVDKGTFKVTDDYSIIKDADYILIDVQTPTDKDHIPRYESLKEVSEITGKHIKKGALVVIESTCAPGTTNYIVKPILEKASGMKAGKDFHLAFSYERVMVGRLIHNIVNYPRIVGGINEASNDIAMELYSHIVKEKLFPTDPLTAEMAKVAENTYRDVNIAFANEVALMCESLGVNVYEVRKLVNTLPFNSNAYRDMHIPGAGVGGHCLPKDPWLMIYGVNTYGKKKIESKVIAQSRHVNDYMPIHMGDLLLQMLKEKGIKPKDAKVTILGFSFLENSDDTRNTPAVPLFQYLKEKGVKDVIIHDFFDKEFKDWDDLNLNLTTDLDGALKDTDAIALVTSHKQYPELSLKDIKKKMKTPIILDGRNIWSKDQVEPEGFLYRGIGKGLE